MRFVSSIAIATCFSFAAHAQLVVQTNRPVDTVTGLPQNETTVAINPTDSMNVIASSNSLTPQVYVTTDAGATWTTVTTLTLTAGGRTYTSAGDPWIDFGADGTAYLSMLLFRATLPGMRESAIVVYISTDKGVTWSAPVVVSIQPSVPLFAPFEDKPMIAADHFDRTNTTVFVSWTQFKIVPGTSANWASEIHVARSTNRGMTWTTETSPSGIVPNVPGVQGSYPVIAPNRDLFVVWQKAALFGGMILNIARWRNGQSVFEAPFQIDTTRIGPGAQSIPPQPRRGVIPLPVLACDNSGALYVAWSDSVPGGSADLDIFLRKSTDNGASWNALGNSAKRVNLDGAGAIQFLPSIAFDLTRDALHIGYYDTRSTAANRQTNYVLASSSDFGTTFSELTVTSATSDMTSAASIAGIEYGDYSGIAARFGVVYAAWTDTRLATSTLAQMAFVGRIAPCPSRARVTVTRGGDTGSALLQTTLRQALAEAVSCTDIDFAIPMTDSTLSFGTFNTTLRAPLFVRGPSIRVRGDSERTFLGASAPPPTIFGKPLIVLRARSDTFSQDTAAVTVLGDDSSINAITIDGINEGTVLRFIGARGAITNSWIGLQETGGSGQDDSRYRVGVGVDVRGDDTSVAGCHVSSAIRTGINVEANRAQIAGNIIGLDAFGGKSANYVGVMIRGADAVVRGNVISGNKTTGLLLTFSGTAAVSGNRIGTNREGTAAIANGGDGLQLYESSLNVIGIPKNRLADPNVISGNGRHGIWVNGRSSSNEIAGNIIGLTADGSAELANGGSGVVIEDPASSNVIGRADEKGRNTIAANQQHGIFIRGGKDAANRIVGNLIGVSARGAAGFGNKGSGVRLENTSANEAGPDNTIAGNAAGVVVAVNGGESAESNAIRGNAVFNNVALGIDLRDDGVTPNDSGDADGGPNLLQNVPVLRSARFADRSLHVQLEYTPNTSAEFDFFSNQQVDPSGSGEGETFLGSASGSADANGRLTLDFRPAAAFAYGRTLTATATDAQRRNTSEFSAPIGVDVKPERGRVQRAWWDLTRRLIEWREAILRRIRH